MSNALAIAGVSAVLKDLLDSGLIDHQVTDALGAGVTVVVARAGRRADRRRRCRAAAQPVSLPRDAERGVAQRRPALARLRTDAGRPTRRSRWICTTCSRPTASASCRPRCCSATACSCCTRIRCSRAQRSAPRSTRRRSVGALLPSVLRALCAARISPSRSSCSRSRRVPEHGGDVASSGPRCRRTTGRPRRSRCRWC